MPALAACRDVADEIRAVVVAALGAWVADAPGTYLTDAHLKYLAWALSDRVRQGQGDAKGRHVH